MAKDAEFWWVVSELVEFGESTPRTPFRVQVQTPPHCIGWFGVFDDYTAAVEFAEGKLGKVQCLRVTRPAEARDA